MGFQEGDQVEANYHGIGTFYKGKIMRKRLNGTYDITYDDGDKEQGLSVSS
jgi:hypothetical protein